MFELGAVVATPAALRHCFMNGVDSMSLIHKHKMGEWGDLSKEDIKANQDAIAFDGRVLSAYVIASVRVYVITEWDRSVTTLLLASEY